MNGAQFVTECGILLMPELFVDNLDWYILVRDSTYNMTLLVLSTFSGNVGEGAGRIWLDNVQCTGNERALRNCHNTAGSDEVSSCTQAQVAGVRCPLGMHVFRGIRDTTEDLVH